jgi:YVTN family beta-propeller protein
VVNETSNSVSVINGANNTVTANVSTGTYPYAIDINPATNTIYVGNFSSNYVTVINGATNATSNITVGGTGVGSIGVNVNRITNMIYVNTVNAIVVINGATNATTTLNVTAGIMAINPVSNTIYAVNCGIGCYSYAGTATVIAINGASNATTTISDPTAIDVGGIAVNPVTNTVYVTDADSGKITEITEQKVQEIPLFTTIDALPNNETESATPTFTVEAISSFFPTAPTPQYVWYQLDTWQGPWYPAAGSTPYFSITTSTLSLGTHILYAFATDGQDANSTGVAQQFIGGMAAYVFAVIPTPSKNGNGGCIGHICRAQ